MAWVVDHVTRWEQHRDQEFKARWDEYYRLWRGIWSPEDRTRESERSRLIAPALSQAVEMAVSEQEEATFGRGRWIDAADDLADPEKSDIAPMITQLIEDFELAGVPSAVSEAYLNGALYGTGIGKVVLETEISHVPSSYTTPGLGVTAQADPKEQIVVRLHAVDPREFVIDPAAKSIEGGLGCAHTPMVPLHSVRAKQKSGVYKGEPIGPTSPAANYAREDEPSVDTATGVVRIIEYHGLVPKSYLFEETPDATDKDPDMVEAIVTIGNDSVLLRAVENPFLMQDRSFVAFPHDKVPNRFWGRGICEKGYNPQKQLDAELRARVDALSFSVHPMMGVDASRLPRGTKFEVKPGRSILTTGDPREILHPIQFPSPDTQTYRQTAEMERMVQMGTGSMDSASPVGVSPRNATASGMSMMTAGALKRSKRTMQNIERYFLRPMVEKALWRYMQFAPERYPVKDYRFVVRSTLGIMAREVEQQQMTNLLQTTPPDSPAYWLIIKAIFENSSVGIRDELIGLMDQMLQQAMEPKEPEPDPNAAVLAARVQLETQIHQDKMMVEVERLKLEARKLENQEQLLLIQHLQAKAEFQEAEAERMRTFSESMLNEAKAKATEVDSALEVRRLEVETALKLSEQRYTRIRDTLAGFDKIFDQVTSAREGVFDTRAALSAQQREASEENRRAISDLSRQIAALALRKPPQDVDLSPVVSRLDALEGSLKSTPPAPEPKRAKTRIERDEQGKVVTVNGQPVERDDNGLIIGLDGE